VDGLVRPYTILWPTVARQGNRDLYQALPCPIVLQWVVVPFWGIRSNGPNNSKSVYVFVCSFTLAMLYSQSHKQRLQTSPLRISKRVAQMVHVLNHNNISGRCSNNPVHRPTRRPHRLDGDAINEHGVG
jgi:hypothetical protein